MDGTASPSPPIGGNVMLMRCKVITGLSGILGRDGAALLGGWDLVVACIPLADFIPGGGPGSLTQGYSNHRWQYSRRGAGKPHCKHWGFPPGKGDKCPLLQGRPQWLLVVAAIASCQAVHRIGLPMYSMQSALFPESLCQKKSVSLEGATRLFVILGTEGASSNKPQQKYA